MLQSSCAKLQLLDHSLDLLLSVNINGQLGPVGAWFAPPHRPLAPQSSMSRDRQQISRISIIPAIADVQESTSCTVQMRVRACQDIRQQAPAAS